MKQKRWRNEVTISYPLTRHILNPNQVNLAFDVIEPNIFQQGGKILGLKVFP
jgi:hypothetical protein